MADLRGQLGWRTAKEYWRSRQISYAGHLGRYADSRPEVQLLQSTLALDDAEVPAAWLRPHSDRVSLHKQFVDTMVEVVNTIHAEKHPEADTLATHEALHFWQQYAVGENEHKRGAEWRAARRKILKEMRDADTKRCWKAN